MNQGSGTSSQQSSSTNSRQSIANKNSLRYALYAIIGIIIIAAAVMLLLPHGVPTTPTTTQATTQSTTQYTTQSTTQAVTQPAKFLPIYLNKSQAKSILGQSPTSYNTYSISNPLNPINITFLTQLDPHLEGNVSSGWTTLATTQSASIEYTLLNTSHAAEIAVQLGSANTKQLNGSFGMVVANITSGTKNGLDYTYVEFKNGAGGTMQLIYGSEGNEVVLNTVTGIFANKSSLINITANYTLP